MKGNEINGEDNLNCVIRDILLGKVSQSLPLLTPYSTFDFALRYANCLCVHMLTVIVLLMIRTTKININSYI